MAFVEIDRNNSDAVFASDLVQVVNLISNLHALLERTQERMDEMTTAQIETLYGISTFGVAVKAQVDAAFTVLDTDAAMVNIRTKLG